jgi:protein translocase SecG subunit
MRQNILAGIQIAISVLLVISVLLQQRGSGVGTVFGGSGAGGGGEFFRARRGAEKFLFYFTIVLSCFLVVTSLLYLYI